MALLFLAIHAEVDWKPARNLIQFTQLDDATIAKTTGLSEGRFGTCELSIESGAWRRYRRMNPATTSY